MSTQGNVKVYLYGKFRNLAKIKDPMAESKVELPCQAGDKIIDIVKRLRIGPDDVSHLFLNGEYSGPNRWIKPGDRLGIFPRELALLYRQYFPVKDGECDGPPGS